MKGGQTACCLLLVGVPLTDDLHINLCNVRGKEGIARFRFTNCSTFS